MAELRACLCCDATAAAPNEHAEVCTFETDCPDEARLLHEWNAREAALAELERWKATWEPVVARLRNWSHGMSCPLCGDLKDDCRCEFSAALAAEKAP
jgi:hypothetical protein